MIASDVYPQIYLEALTGAIEAAPESAARRNAVVCLENARWCWETYNGDAAKARALRGLTHLVVPVEAERLINELDAQQAEYEAQEQAAEAYAEGAWLRHAERGEYDPIEDAREAMDLGLQEMRSWGGEA